MYDYIKLTQTCRASDDRLADGKQLLGDLQSPGVGRRQQVVNKQEQLRKKELGTSYKGARGFKSGKPRGVMGQSRGVSRSKAELHKMRGSITQDAGEPWTGRPFEWLRAHIRAAFVSLVEKYFVYGGKLATYETLTYCPDLGLCATNWKVDALATEVYSQWSRYHRDEIQSHRPAPVNTNTNGKRKSGESESSIASKKRKPDSSVSKASTKTASTKTTKKRTRKASPTSAPNTAPVAVTFASDTTSPANSSPMVSSSTSTLFAGLFALPQAPGSVIEGSCDELPICQSGDEKGPFRCLFKYIYAPALETQANRISITDLQDILAVVHLAHKYEMTVWETWSFLVIGDLIRRHPSSLLSHDFVAIYNYCRRAFTEESEDLWIKTSVQWLERITDNDLSISDTLNAAEASHDRHFLTSLYKIQLSQIPTTAASMFQPTQLSIDRIPPVHVQRILAGFCSLSLSWSELRQNMITLPRHAICSDDYHHSICIPATTSHWINAVTQAEKFSISEICHRINAVIQHLSAQTPRNRYVSERYQYGSDAQTPLTMWNQELTRNMEGHFFGMNLPWRTDPHSLPPPVFESY
ncbi:hypothetical protein B0H13DRAFT_1850855 [Mycena leptocephala]|nr:hypothetical protein B0H13DRAFT_1850855 [Mycena leptocephala]